MGRRTTLGVIGAAIVVVAVAALLGSAGAVHAGPRAVDFTLSPGLPDPATYGKHVAFTMTFQNTSGTTLTQVRLDGTATGGATFDTASSSAGTCGPGADAASFTCTFPNQSAGAPPVTVTAVYVAPAATSGFTSTTFTPTLTIKESGGDPGSKSIFASTPPSTTVPYQTQTPDRISDVLGKTGGSLTTDEVTKTNLTKTQVSLPNTGFFQPLGITEGPTDPAACGSGATPILDNSQIDAPGPFLTPITVVLDLSASDTKGKTPVGCHNGAVVAPSCPALVADYPPQGCLVSRDKVKNAVGVQVWRLVMQSLSNGTWNGGV